MPTKKRKRKKKKRKEEIKKKKKSVMLETKATKTMGKLFAKNCNLCMFTWLKAKIQIQFYNKKTYNSLTTQIHFSV